MMGRGVAVGWGVGVAVGAGAGVDVGPALTEGLGLFTVAAA